MESTVFKKAAGRQADTTGVWRQYHYGFVFKDDECLTGIGKERYQVDTWGGFLKSNAHYTVLSPAKDLNQFIAVAYQVILF